jgi:hypothetical protein
MATENFTKEFGMAKKVPLHRMRDISKPRSIRRNNGLQACLGQTECTSVSNSTSNKGPAQR